MNHFHLLDHKTSEKVLQEKPHTQNNVKMYFISTFLFNKKENHKSFWLDLLLFLLFCCFLLSSGPPKIQGISCCLALINSPHLYLLKPNRAKKTREWGDFGQIKTRWDWMKKRGRARRAKRVGERECGRESVGCWWGHSMHSWNGSLMRWNERRNGRNTQSAAAECWEK